MLEIIAQIKEAEQAADDRRREAVKLGRQAVSEAHKKGEQLLQESKAEALKQAAAEYAQAEAREQEVLALQEKQYEEECRTMYENACKKLNAAADVIVERIVSAS